MRDYIISTTRILCFGTNPMKLENRGSFLSVKLFSESDLGTYYAIVPEYTYLILPYKLYKDTYLKTKTVQSYFGRPFR